MMRSPRHRGGGGGVERVDMLSMRGEGGGLAENVGRARSWGVVGQRCIGAACCAREGFLVVHGRKWERKYGMSCVDIRFVGHFVNLVQRAGQSSTTSSKVDPFQIQRKMKPSKVPSMEQKREEIKLNIVLPQ